MNKLEKSIRHELNYHGAGIRAGHYGVADFTTGKMPKKGFLSAACADVENGIVSDIRLYCYGDAMERRDYYGESIDIKLPIEKYIMNEFSWDEMISEIETIITGQA